MRHDYGERTYLDLLQHILETGVRKSNRTGIDTIGVFGAMLKFDLSIGFPLLTTKKVAFRLIAEELLWFIRGETNINSLREKNVHIWDEWAKPDGDVGPVYGKQWRNFSGPFTGKDGHDYSATFAKHGDMGSGVYRGHDQLAHVISTLKLNPDDRRMIVSTWNPLEIPFMGLPPCHVMFQFHTEPVEGESYRKLNCAMYQRSCDMFLGVPYNIASYALLTHMIAHLVDMRVGTFTHFLSDAHVYENHVPQVKEQINRFAKAPPQLRIVRDVQSIDDFKIEDFQVLGYDPHPPIKGDVAV